MSIQLQSGIMGKYYIGVDVGTAGVRVAAFDAIGTKLCSANKPIRVLNPKSDYFEQSSNEIWQACCFCIKVCTVEQFRYSFEATCI